MSNEATRPESANRRAEPQSFRARSLDASLTVKDLEKNLAWYQDVVVGGVIHIASRRSRFAYRRAANLGRIRR